MSDWPGVRLHVVTGKGGTGKSTTAAALALALASEGRDVLLCEVEGRQGIARMFDVDPLPYEERRIATGLPRRGSDGPAAGGGSGGPAAAGGHGRQPGSVHALHVDPESALLEYLAMYYRLGRAGRLLDRFGVVDFATTLAPGVRDVLLTGKVFEAAKPGGRRGGGRAYDAVVLDAPPTGRIVQFLGVSDELAGLAKVGPIKKQADLMMTLFRSEATAIHLTTVLEEMPTQETTDGIAELREAGLPVGGVVVGMVRPRDLDDEQLDVVRSGGPDHDAVAADLVAAGLGDEADAGALDGLVDVLLAEGRDHAERRALEDEQREVLARLDRPTYELPRLAAGVDLAGLYELAGHLRRQGVA